MAGELTVSGGMSFNKGGASASRSYQKSVDVAGADYVLVTILVLTTVTTLDLGSISTLGYLMAKNLDTTNYVDIGYPIDSSTVGYPFKMKALESFGPARCKGASAKFRANTASCRCEVFLVED